MGYALAMGPCYGCGRVFGFNPLRVPSVVVDGVREPLCEVCVERNGMPLIVPLPDTWDACDEGEL